MNAMIFQTINGVANTSKMIDFIGLFFADYLLYLVGIAFIIILFIKKTRLMAISIAVTTFLARIVIAEPLKRIVHLARPYVSLDDAKKIVSENGDYLSFPSGHTTIFFAIAMAIYFFNKKWGIIAFVIAALVGIARIYVGVHWPLDVVAGALIGILSGIIVNKFVIKLTL
jgi:undecaprenyl-diphosphatase